MISYLISQNLVQYQWTITCSKSTIETAVKEVINDSVPIRKNTDQRKPVFLHILHSILFLHEINISKHNEDVKPIHDGGMPK